MIFYDGLSQPMIWSNPNVTVGVNVLLIQKYRRNLFQYSTDFIIAHLTNFTKEITHFVNYDLI